MSDHLKYPHALRHIDYSKEPHWKETGHCDACGNPNGKHVNKVYPSGTMALYYSFKGEAWVCVNCWKEAEANHCNPKLRLSSNGKNLSEVNKP